MAGRRWLLRARTAFLGSAAAPPRRLLPPLQEGEGRVPPWGAVPLQHCWALGAAGAWGGRAGTAGGGVTAEAWLGSPRPLTRPIFWNRKQA